MDGYVKCDRCSARALREFVLDSGRALYACLHHAAAWSPNLPPESRFDLEPTTLYGCLGPDSLADLDKELTLNA